MRGLISTAQRLPRPGDAIKNHKAYLPSIGKILAIEGAEQTGPDLNIVQPDFDAILKGNSVFLNWGWAGTATTST